MIISKNKGPKTHPRVCHLLNRLIKNHSHRTFLALHQSGRNEAICNSLLAQIESIYTIWNEKSVPIHKNATKTTPKPTLVWGIFSGGRLCFLYLLVVLIELFQPSRKMQFPFTVAEFAILNTTKRCELKHNRWN